MILIQTCVGVVLAAGGYRITYAKGKTYPVWILRWSNDKKIFHAGTRLQDGKVLTNGGRVLCATALGDTITEAQQAAYKLADSISWDELYCRRDIAYRAVARRQQTDA